TATGDFDAGFWYRRLDPLTCDYYKQTLLKSERYQNLPANQKKELDEVLAAREEMLQKPDRSPLNKVLDRAGVAMDFMSAVESWHSYFSQKKDLTLQEQAYLQIVTSVTQEHLDLLIAWEERVWEDPNLSAHEKECICGALAALMLEVAATGDETLNALAQNNASLTSFSAKADAAASTTEFIINLLGAAKNDPLAASGGLGAAVIGAQVVDLFITLIGGEEYFDAYEKVRALHDLQASLTTQVLSRLETYRFHRSDALANAIISELNLIKEIKLVGEELVMMYYLSDFCSEFGLENAPTMFAVLMEEVLQAPSSHEMDAKGSCQRMWGVYQREVTLDVLLGQALNAAQVESDPLGCFPEVYAAGDTTAMASMTDTLLGYYHMEGQPVTFNGAALEALPQIYESRVGALPEKYLNLPGGKVPFGTLSQMPGSAYQGVVKEDPSWRQRQLPEIDSLNSVFVEPVYLYQKGSTMAVFSENEWLAYQKVEERVEEMLKRYDGSNPEDHQTEERLMWGRLTNHYIESFKMYDPQGDYPLNPPLKP
ncbi:MAG: hypothetical protein IJF65_07695, partial [Clostridia bacterium]|nr:hypothetical protein [Clostridia bacterium]